jgi:hypothetical protein
MRVALRCGKTDSAGPMVNGAFTPRSRAGERSRLVYLLPDAPSRMAPNCIRLGLRGEVDRRPFASRPSRGPIRFPKPAGIPVEHDWLPSRRSSNN